VSRARQVLALLLFAVFLYLLAGLTPPFLRNLRLQRYLEALTQTPAVATQPPERTRAQVLQRAAELGLPVEASGVRVEPSGAAVRISVRYVLPVRLPGYTVKLHFSPSAGR
jgi:hypothetical protein